MVNFLLVLPIVNAAFVTLLPYSVSLGSKLLFGLAMAGILYTAQRTVQAGNVALRRSE